MKRRVRGRCGSNGADSCWETISFLRVSSLFIFPTSPLIIRIDSVASWPLAGKNIGVWNYGLYLASHLIPSIPLCLIL